MPKLTGIDHLVLTVRDMDATVAFYTDALSMTIEDFVVSDGSTRRALKFGTQKINLHPATGPFRPHAENPVPGSADLCFVTRAPLKNWVAHLDGLKIAILDGPIKRTGAQGPVTSIYVRDPDSNLIEISTYG